MRRITLLPTTAWTILIPAFVMPFAANQAHASALSEAAAAMQPGEWRVLNQGGDASGWGHALLTTGSDNVLNYADKALWDPSSHQLHFLGKGAQGQAFKFLTYTESTNTWLQEPKPYWDCSPADNCLGHGYEHSTLDPATGNVFWRPYDSEIIYKWTRASGTWSAPPTGPNPTIAVAIEYFPERGSFILVGAGRVHEFNTTTNNWTPLATNLDMGEYHNVASYNPVHHIVIFGGGNDSSRLYKIDSTGTITPIHVAPIPVGIQASIFTVDPVSGRQLLFGSDGSFYQYNVMSNSWSPLPGAGIPLWAPDENRILFRAAVPIASNGVIAFLTTYSSDGDSRVYLYKHASTDIIFQDDFEA